MDIFDEKSASPMLIAEMQDPFDSPEYIYELKLDGERCLAYLDENGTVLQNKRKLILNSRYPELNNLHKNVKGRCILDGELAVLVDGKPNFEEVKRRSLMSNKIKIDVAASKYPACFTAFDILYSREHQTTEFTLLQRKKLLNETVIKEDSRFAISRIIDANGVSLYNLAAKQELEGVVAKKKESLYYMGKRTKDWIKFKNLQDDDFVVLGYIEKDKSVVSLILGQYDGSQIVNKGHVTLGVSRDDFKSISQLPHTEPAGHPSQSDEGAVWVEPKLVCTVKFMERTSAGGLRQPIYKGLRDDKVPEECQAR